MSTAVISDSITSTDVQRQRRRRVLHIVNGEHYAGAARVQDLLALHLPDFGYDVTFACVHPGKFETERKSQDVRLLKFPMKHRLDFGPAESISRLIASEKFDLIHSHTTRSAMIATMVAKANVVPYVHHVHCQMNTEMGRKVQSIVNTSIERFACRTADRVIAVSESIERFLISRRFSKGHIKVVPNGVPRQEKRKAERDGNDPWVIGMVALLRERKGLETLVAALPKLSANHDVRLRIVGPFESPEYQRHIELLVKKLDVGHLIEWTGFIRDVSAEIRRMDVLVLPSVLPEGMPMVLLEAMALGVPVVGSRVDGVTDVIRHQRNGLLFDAGDANDLSAQLTRLICGDVDWNELRRHCLTDFAEKYAAEVMAERVAGVYDEILMGQTARRRAMLGMA